MASTLNCLPEGWQSLEEILTPQMHKPVYLRSESSLEYPIQKGKLFNFGSLLNDRQFALVLKIKPEEKKATQSKKEEKPPEQKAA